MGIQFVWLNSGLIMPCTQPEVLSPHQRKKLEGRRHTVLRTVVMTWLTCLLNKHADLSRDP